MSGGSSAQKAVAKLMNVSVSLVQRAGKVREYGVPELERAVMSGSATIESAYWLAMYAEPTVQRLVLAEAAGSKAALSRLVAALRRSQDRGPDYPSHRCACGVCGRAL